jgi:hypothetical protein
MTQEIFKNENELESLVVGLSKTFIRRWDLYARQFDDGSYACVRKPLKLVHVAAHLQGDLTLGVYVLDKSSHARYLVIDADDETQFKQLAQICQDLKTQAVPSYLEASRRGGHLWLFLPKPSPGKQARLFGQRLLEKYTLSSIELFPKQNRLGEGPGSLIRLPFGIHRKTGERYGFISSDGQPLANTLPEQAAILCAPQTVPEGFFQALLTQTPAIGPKPVLNGVQESKKPLSQRIKESIGALDFISQYVELSPTGRGQCPFHNDQHASFAVNVENNYWHCFAGCGGGSIIDFWMKRQGCDFTTAVRELAALLLPLQNEKEPGKETDSFNNCASMSS